MSPARASGKISERLCCNSISLAYRITAVPGVGHHVQTGIFTTSSQNHSGLGA